jgi:hypothetical protein
LKSFLWRETKGIFPASNTNNQPQTMDTYYAAPLNAKGTCFRIIIVEDPAAARTPKHIKTKAKKN